MRTQTAVASIATALLLSACSAASVVDTAPPTSPTAPSDAGTSVPEPTTLPTSTMEEADYSGGAGLTFSTAEGLWQIGASSATSLVVDQPSARLSPDGSKVAYLQTDPENGKDDVWLLDRTTGTSVNLTQTPDRFETVPFWWPGRLDTIIFGSDVETGMLNSDYPTAVGIDGTNYQVLDSERGGPRALSPDGSSIAYGGYDAPGRLYLWKTGPQPFDPSEYGVPANKLFQPSYSPDGAELAWLVGGDLSGNGSYKTGLAVFDLKTMQGRLMHGYQPVGGGTFPLVVAWSPAGDWIAFVTFGEPPSSGRAPNLWVIRPDGSDETYVGEGLDPTWSPDGRFLAYLRTGAESDQEIWTATAGTWEAVRLDLPPEASRTLFLMGWSRP